ncbi:MAG TPA: TolC family outer membrane protein [Xanthobacteraceae bacterium]|nr:TolC family outer membrane protein [Xanthobacteraceae bacterium]
MTRIGVILLCFSGLTLGAVGPSAAAEPFTINDAINQAIRTHPGVGEAAANRRATEAELRQTQGTLLPQVRLEARTGYNRFNQPDLTPALVGNGQWMAQTNQTVIVRQLLFDGFSSINDIWRQAARVDAAAARVHERTELIALDAISAYIEVTRYSHIVQVAENNLVEHRKIFANVQARFRGGRAGEGDLEQAQERVASAEAALHQYRRNYDEARAAYRSAVGLEPFNVRFPGRLSRLPNSRDQALSIALAENPTIKAAKADADSARYAFRTTDGTLSPTISLEGRAQKDYNASSTIPGHSTNQSGLLVFSWDVFRGGQDSWRRVEMSERYIEATQRYARLQREAFSSVDKAWAARTIASDQVVALQRQVESDRKVISAYTKEYELGQRSLIDLLNAHNQYFTGLVGLDSARGVAVFGDYQLLAFIGRLLAYVKMPQRPEAAPLDPKPLGLFPTAIAPIIVNPPEPSGPEPLNLSAPTPEQAR